MAEVSQIRVKGTLYDIKDAVARLSTGAPATAASVAAMTDTSKIYVYTGSESGYTNGNWYYNNGSSWVSGGVYNSAAVETDTSLSVSGAPADAKVTGDAINNIVYVGTEASDSHTQVIVSPNSQEIELVTQAEFDTELSDLKSQISSMGDGVPTEVRQAFATLVDSALFKVDGLAEEKALIHSWASVISAITLNQSSISINGVGTYQLVATTTPSGGTVSWTSSDTSVATVSSTGLVTSVSNGTATITASCGGLSASCTATISGFATLTSISAVYTQDGDVYPWTTLDDLKADLVVTATYSDSSTQVLSDDAYTLSGSLVVGTDTITVSYLNQNTTFNVTVTEKWSYSLADLIKVTGTYANNTGANCGIALGRTTYRRSFAVDRGVTPIALASASSSAVDAQTSDYYPIKVPAGCTRFTVSVTPSTQYVQVLTRQLNDGVYSSYSAPGGSGYIEGSTTRTPASCPDNVYIFVTTKYNNAGTSYPTEPTGLDITFERGEE